jgi:putative transposase
MTDEDPGVAPEYQISDELWERIEPLLPSPKPKKKSGRP